MSIKAMVALGVSLTLGATSAALGRAPTPTNPNGTPAQLQQCAANMEAALHGQSPLGSRDTSAYIQDRGNLDSSGLTEYDVLVGRCMTQFYHRYLRRHGGAR